MGYDRVKAARDALMYQMDDAKLRNKVIVKDQPLEQVIRMDMANEQAGKVADRIKPIEEQEVPKHSITALEEKVGALSVIFV